MSNCKIAIYAELGNVEDVMLEIMEFIDTKEFLAMRLTNKRILNLLSFKAFVWCPINICYVKERQDFKRVRIIKINSWNVGSLDNLFERIPNSGLHGIYLSDEFHNTMFDNESKYVLPTITKIFKHVEHVYIDLDHIAHIEILGDEMYKIMNDNGTLPNVTIMNCNSLEVVRSRFTLKYKNPTLKCDSFGFKPKEVIEYIFTLPLVTCKNYFIWNLSFKHASATMSLDKFELMNFTLVFSDVKNTLDAIAMTTILEPAGSREFKTVQMKNLSVRITNDHIYDKILIYRNKLKKLFKKFTNESDRIYLSKCIFDSSPIVLVVIEAILNDKINSIDDLYNIKNNFTLSRQNKL